MEPIKAYFDKAVMKYSRGDVLQLLEAKLTCAGPLLNIVMDGIDHLGGMRYGFDSNPGSKKRSIDFMKEEMGMSEEHAELLYIIVRCGMTHEGMPKIGIKFFVLYTQYESGKIFYTGNDGYIWLNVVELAHLYIDTVDKISENQSTKISYLPEPEDINRELFERARSTISDSIESLVEKIADHEWTLKFQEGSSFAAYTPANTLHFIDLP